MVPQGKVWLHLRNIATQWHIKHIIIPEEKSGRIVRKEDQSLSGKTANPIALCLMSKDLDGSVLSTLLTSTHSSFLSWFHSLHSVLLGRYSMILASSTSWDGPDTLVFIIIVLHSGLSGSLALHRLHVRILLSQAELSVTLWNWERRFHDPLTLVSFKTEKQALCGQYCHVWQSVWERLWSPWITLAASTSCSFPGSILCRKYCIISFTSWKLSWWDLDLRASFCVFLFQPVTSPYGINFLRYCSHSFSKSLGWNINLASVLHFSPNCAVYISLFFHGPHSTSVFQVRLGHPVKLCLQHSVLCWFKVSMPSKFL